QSRPLISEVDLTEDMGRGLPGRWVSACDLRERDVLFLRTGKTASVRAVSQREDRTPVCNLTVGDLHSFAVGEAQVLVHNTPGSGSPSPNGGGTASHHPTPQPHGAPGASPRSTGYGPFDSIYPGPEPMPVPPAGMEPMPLHTIGPDGHRFLYITPANWS